MPMGMPSVVTPAPMGWARKGLVECDQRDVAVVHDHHQQRQEPAEATALLAKLQVLGVLLDFVDHRITHVGLLRVD
jgi:hypothetical protein